MQSNNNLKSCVVKSPSKNVKQENAILSEFEKMTNCVGQNYKSADVLTIGELTWTRTLNISEHTSSTPVPIPRAIPKPIVLLQSFSPKVQKTVRRLQLDRCQFVANCAYNCSLVPSLKCEWQKLEETFRHFIFEDRRHRAHRSHKFLSPDIHIYEEDWVTKLIKFKKFFKRLEPRNNDRLHKLPTTNWSKTLSAETLKCIPHLHGMWKHICISIFTYIFIYL